ncbi:MAG: HAD-IIIC family phosphatase [Planctomycetaceae bacterium]
MQLFEALKTIRDRGHVADGLLHSVDLICGFTPLHLRTLFAAELTSRYSTGAVDVSTGLFGDIAGSLEQSLARCPESAVVILEWADLDPRLGFRSSGGWRPDRIADIIESTSSRLRQLATSLAQLASKTTLAVCLPTLELPPLFPSPNRLADISALQLRSLIASFAVTLAETDSIRILDAQQIDRVSPVAARFDAAAELRSGFPYTMDHAAALAGELAALLRPTPALKGIITDLDNTFWSGLVGEDGLYGISWDLDHKTHLHAVYQGQLAALAELGVLVGVASKNDRQLVEQAFQRSDLIFPAENLFPVEAGWGPKSQSVRKILDTWNISADSVIFIDDSPIELAEVEAAFPQIECRQFPVRDEAGVVTLLEELRSLFGRASISTEDRIRIRSLRAAGGTAPAEVNSDIFLSTAEADIRLDWNLFDERSLQLINKTNQFNLNGHRLDEADWRQRMNDPDSLLLGITYTDKFSPLGKISVLLGRRQNETISIDSWVLSCRAFSRRIEHAAIQALLNRTGCRRVTFQFEATDRNGPFQNTLHELTGEQPATGTVVLRQSAFQANCPTIFAKVTDNDAMRDAHAA